MGALIKARLRNTNIPTDVVYANILVNPGRDGIGASLVVYAERGVGDITPDRVVSDCVVYRLLDNPDNPGKDETKPLKIENAEYARLIALPIPAMAAAFYGAFRTAPNVVEWIEDVFEPGQAPVEG